MGTRVNYEITNGEGRPAIVLYANNSSSEIDPDHLFVGTVRDCRTLSEGVSTLLGLRHAVASGAHRAGDPIFTLDLDPEDREYVVRARVDGTIEGSPQTTYFECVGLDGTVLAIDPETLEVVRPFPGPA